MKIVAPLFVASAAALKTSTSASSLLAAIGHRNATQMEALVQGLAEESITEPGFKFDADILDALKAIRTMFVKSIQKALMEQHQVDQESHNCETQSCFDDCWTTYEEALDNLKHKEAECMDIQKEHEYCRKEVFDLYRDMGIKCGKLHCFDLPTITCQDEDCICPDVNNCAEPSDKVCTAKSDECKSRGYGNWLQQVVNDFKAKSAQWEQLYSECKTAYHLFLTEDVHCDKTQKEFEDCMCQKSYQEEQACSVTYVQCNVECRQKYDASVPNLECQERDRKIDWSATKKMECYLDVLLHDYTKDELLKKCETDNCVNEQREKDYKHCGTICPEVDFDGSWSEPCCDEDGKVEFCEETTRHEMRKQRGQYHLGDEFIKKDETGASAPYDCDANGNHIHTQHRKFPVAEWPSENRCTEHLDIDFQIPPFRECKPPSGHVCDDEFHCKYYRQFDKLDADESPTMIGCITDCCTDDKLEETSGKQGCYAKESLKMCVSPEEEHDVTKKIYFGEHSYSWGYNRCPCKACDVVFPGYAGGIEKMCTGVHTGPAALPVEEN